MSTLEQSLLKRLAVLRPEVLAVIAVSVTTLSLPRRGSFWNALLLDGLPSVVIVCGVFTAQGVFILACQWLGRGCSRTRLTQWPLPCVYAMAGLPLAPLYAIAITAWTRALSQENLPLSWKTYGDAAITGLGTGGFVVATLVMLYPSGIGIILKPLLSPRPIVIIRKFFDQRAKIVLEHVLPVAANHFGQFAVIEAPTEYTRHPQPSWDEPTFVRQPLMLAAIPLPDQWMPDFFEMWLGRTTRLRFAPDTWQDSVRLELARAHAIVVDVTQFSEHVVWELEQAQALGRGDRIILIKIGQPGSSALRRYARTLSARGIRIPTGKPIEFRIPAAPLTHKQLIQTNASALSRLMRQLAALERKPSTSQRLIVAGVWMLLLATQFAAVNAISGRWQQAIGLTMTGVSWAIVSFGRGREVFQHYRPLDDGPQSILGRSRCDEPLPIEQSTFR